MSSKTTTVKALIESRFVNVCHVQILNCGELEWFEFDSIAQVGGAAFCVIKDPIFKCGVRMDLSEIKAVEVAS